MLSQQSLEKSFPFHFIPEQCESSSNHPCIVYMSVAQSRIQVVVPNQDASKVESVSQQYGISPSNSQSPPLNQFYCSGSRYVNDFVEITKLGKGGFGSVVKVYKLSFIAKPNIYDCLFDLSSVFDTISTL